MAFAPSFCPSCGIKLGSDANFCDSCGYNLNAPTVPEAPSLEPAREAAPRVTPTSGCGVVPASTYGLVNPGDKLNSEFNKPRVTLKFPLPDGKVTTVAENYNWQEHLNDPNPPKGPPKRHYGNDYQSHNADGKVDNVPFKAGFHGWAWAIPGSVWGTINLRLDNGVLLQFLHAATRLVPYGDEHHAIEVTPDSILGLTGQTGPLGHVDGIHLHVQAKLLDGSYIDPNCASSYHQPGYHPRQHQPSAPPPAQLPVPPVWVPPVMADPAPTLPKASVASGQMPIIQQILLALGIIALCIAGGLVAYGVIQQGGIGGGTWYMHYNCGGDSTCISLSNGANTGIIGSNGSQGECQSAMVPFQRTGIAPSYWCDQSSDPAEAS